MYIYIFFRVICRSPADPETDVALWNLINNSAPAPAHLLAGSNPVMKSGQSS